MSKITEIMPDDAPEWAIEAMANGNLFRVTFDRVEKLEAEIAKLKRMSEEYCENCGYTEKDALIHADHHLCVNKNPPWEKVDEEEPTE